MIRERDYDAASARPDELNDWFSFGGMPWPEELMDPVIKQLDGSFDDEKLVDDVFAATRRAPKEQCADWVCTVIPRRAAAPGAAKASGPAAAAG